MMKTRDLWFVTAVTAAGLVLRLWQINADMWLDEIQTLLMYMRLPPLEAVSSFHAPNQHVLNSFLGSISIRIFGETALAVRLPALLFGVATIPVFFKLAMMVTERREAIFSTLFLTLSYHHVWFSQNARGYSAMIFLTVLSTLMLMNLLDGSRPRSAKTVTGFIICSCLGMLSLLNYAFVLAGQFLAALMVLIHKRDWTGTRQLFIGGAFIVALSLLAYAVILPSLLDYFGSGGGSLNWSHLQIFAGMMISGLTSGLAVFAIPIIVIGGTVVLSGCISYWKNQRMIVLMFFLPGLFNMLALVILGLAWFPRAFLYVLPFAILILMRGSFVLGEWLVGHFQVNKRLAYLLPVLLLVASVIMLPHNYRYPKQDHTASLAYTRAQAAPGDVIAVVGFLSYGYRNYYAPDLEFPNNAEELEALRGPNHRVWVLYSYTLYLRSYSPAIWALVKNEYKQQAVFPGTLGDGTVYLVVAAELASPEPL
jgi:mannosyltransferase